ncbi:polysaccharide pyruvyl transferase family protein [Herbiconiux sp. CPCC 205763]|uniref:Polysaccharide pyruvyl transferase family protein n=1 Tax=Herbiconiux aconitum TaxID=2970913 RepID=A0ABT2GKK8_9MICO|nr:polysaccharide pyruvyl transferase family protein [Herbiconiux aconitum]MCS5716758.1 polysaccharide pyruvyl transferase family protein [Herbiconiux aconitum]
MAELARAAWGPETVVEFQNFGAGDSDISFGTRTIARDFGRRSGPIKSKLRQYDAIIDSGAGDSFTDIYGARRLLTMHYVHRSAKQVGVPLVFGPQTIGPFNTRWGRTIARRSLRASTGVLVRDSISETYTKRLGFVPAAHATDVVFNLEVPERRKRFEVLFNVSGLLWSENSHVDYVRYQAAVRSLIQGLRDSGREVALLAHVLANSTHDDDTSVVRELAAELNIQALVPEDLDDVRSMVADADLVIGSRMHACLNALSVGTPAIPLAYSRKFAPLLDDIGWNHTIDLRKSDTVAEEALVIAGQAAEGLLDADVSSLRTRTSERLQDAADALRVRVPSIDG